MLRAHRPTDAATVKVHIWDQSGRPLCGNMPGVLCFHGRIITEVEPKPDDGCFDCFRRLRFRLSGQVKLRPRHERAPQAFSDRTKRLPRRECGRWVKADQQEPPAVEVG